MDNNKRLLSRAVYKRIKTMDREQLSDHVTKVYLSGFKAGRKAATPDLLLRTIRDELLSIPGIGPTRADAILKRMGDTFATNQAESTEASIEIGQTVWFLLDDDTLPNGWSLSEDRVAAVGKDGFYVPGMIGPECDPANICYIPYTDMGVEVFLTKEAAEEAKRAKEAQNDETVD